MAIMISANSSAMEHERTPNQNAEHEGHRKFDNQGNQQHHTIRGEVMVTQELELKTGMQCKHYGLEETR
jgi:hypothetical protein